MPLALPSPRASHRTIPLPEMAISALKAWKLACPPTSADLVFPSLTGRPMSWNYMVERLFYPIQIEAGEFQTTVINGEPVKKPLWGLHDFRHAAASLWIEQGVNPKRVQYLMGHSSITVTFDTYGHLFEQSEQDKQTSSAIQNALFSDAI
nr:tyrosine-type recombinase/integrase [uncultured Sphingorhabdus sp.]